MKENRNIQYLITFSVSVASVATGCFVSWLSPVIPKFHNNETKFNATDDQIAWMVAMSSPGFMAGSLVTRYISDAMGRRTTILAGAMPLAVGTVIAACAAKPWLLYVARFLWGVGTGIISTIASLYLAELADKEIRGRLSLTTRSMFQFGNLLLMWIGPVVSYETLNYMLVALPILHFVVCWWIPESPQYCLKEGKKDQARKVLALIRRYENDKALEDDLSQLQSDVKNDMRDKSSARELFTGKKYRKAVIISAGLKCTQIFTGTVVIQQYLGAIMYESQTDMKLVTAFMIFGTLRFLVGVLSSYLTDKVGRRPLLIYSYLGNGISNIIVGAYFFFLETGTFQVESLKSYSIIPFLGIIFSTAISTLGFHSIIVVVPAEIFPLNVKAIALTAISIFGGLLNFFVARGYQITKDIMGLCGVFSIFGFVSIIGGIFCILYVPETKGLTLKQIQMDLQGDLYVTDEVKKLNEVNRIGDVDGSDQVELSLLNKKENV